MSHSPLRIAYITAGAAGMYCGSCLRDSTLARGLTRIGVDAQLIPLYTPIRTDGEDPAIDRVFFGGVNIYLQQRFSLFRRLPSLADWFLDRPWLLRWAASRALETDARVLGELAVSMLRGEHGRQQKEVRKLCRWLADDCRPNLVNLTNVLIAGFAPELKSRLDAPILATLQGDDLFLDQLVEPYRSQAMAQIRRLLPSIDGFIVFSRYYADHMADYLGIPPGKIEITPLGVETRDFAELDAPDLGESRSRPPTIGYLARLAPEKGLHLLVEAFLALRRRPELSGARLRVAGYLDHRHRPYAESQFARIRDAGLADDFHYVGEVDRRGKLEFLRSIDVLSVPTVYREAKGLFVLEALAAGVPVVQPAHGAFPELLEATGGGRLTRPGDAQHLADVLAELLVDEQARRALGERGRTAVHSRFNAESMARATLGVYQRRLAGDR